MNHESRIKKKPHNSYFIARDSRLGFTLIELLAVFSIVGVLSTIGVVSFVTYSRSQAIQSSASELVTTLSLARSRAFSQVKPASGCSRLDGYKIGFCSISSAQCQPSETTPVLMDYALYTVCNGSMVSPALVAKKFPTGVSFIGSSNPPSLTFTVLTGGVIGAASDGSTAISVGGFGKTPRIISIFSDGRIATQ